jgi:hypothetical protein
VLLGIGLCLERVGERKLGGEAWIQIDVCSEVQIIAAAPPFPAPPTLLPLF